MSSSLTAGLLRSPDWDFGSAAVPRSPRHEYEWGSLETIVLSNGLTTHVARMHDNRLTHQQLLYPFGSAIELPGELGLSHLLEHIMGDASGRFPSCQARDEFLARRAIESNATTSPFLLSAYVNSLSSDYNIAAEVLSSGYPQGRPSECQLEKHRNIVIQEIDQCLRTPEAIFEHLAAWEFLHPDPRFHDSLGSREVVQNCTLSKINDFRNKTYGTFRPELLLVGDVRPELLDYWGGVKIDGINPGQLTEGLIEQPSDLQSPWVRAGDQRILHYPDPHRTALDCRLLLPGSCIDGMTADMTLCRALIGDLSSPLMLRLREREQLIYSISPRLYNQTSYGVVSLSFSARNVAVAERIIRCVLEETRALAAEGISDGIWEGITNSIKRRQAMATDSAQSNDLPRILVWSKKVSGSFISPSEFRRREAALTREDLSSVAQRVSAQSVAQLIIKGSISQTERTSLLAALD